MTSIEIKNLNKFYGKDSARVHVLKDLNFSTESGKLVLILGPSGAGKSTFLTIAGGLQHPDTGSIVINGEDLSKQSKKQQEKMRLDQIGFVLQAYNLVPYLRVKEQFELVDRVKKEGNMNQEELNELLDHLGLLDFVNKYPDQLSGGQRQRVAIARALYTKPSIVLADEPTAALDSERVKEVGQLLAELAHAQNRTIVVVTHDVRLYDKADEVYHLEDGVLVKETKN